MSIPPINATSLFPTLPTVADTSATTGVAASGSTTASGATSGAGFSDMISNALDSVQAAQQNADGLATQAATGGLADVQDYLIAATQASVDTQITAAVRDKAIQAFQSIMGMPV